MKSIQRIFFVAAVCFASLFNTAKAQLKYAPNAINVAVMVFDGVEILDFTGPCEVFADASNESGKLCNVYTVGITGEEIKAQGFLKVKPNYSLDNCPRPDLIVIPGGNSRLMAKNEAVLNWLMKYKDGNTSFMSVCTGVFLIANIGLLDKKMATTHFCCQDDLAEEHPQVNVVKGVRFVDNGNVITTEGISAGIDGSLYVIEKRFGHAVAKDVAEYMMYDWRPDEIRKMVN